MAPWPRGRVLPKRAAPQLVPSGWDIRPRLHRHLAFQRPERLCSGQFYTHTAQLSRFARSKPVCYAREQDQWIETDMGADGHAT